MNQRGLWRGLFAVALLLLALPSFAQTTGRVEGRVLDSSGALVPGATVTVSGPNLQGVRTTTSDGDGRFRFVALPPGTYTVKSELAGFASVERSNVRVQLDSTVSLELSMSPKTMSDSTTVVGDAPVIDVTSTTTGAKFDSTLFDRLPVARNFQSLALAAPSVTTGGLGNNNPSVSGASAAENRFVVDGLDTTDPAFGTSNVSLPNEFIQEVEIKTGGYQAEYSGALGGILNVLTKSGSNKLKGDLFTYYSDDNLRSTSARTQTFGQDLGIKRQFDFGLDIGGKLIEDKLWFFAAVNPTFTDRSFESRLGTPSTEKRKNVLFSGKLTWQANPNHTIVASVFGDPGKSDNLRFTGNTAGVQLQNNTAASYNYSATYNGILSPSVFLKISAGRSDQNEKEFPVNDSPRYTDQARGVFIQEFASGPGCGDASLAAGQNGISFNPGCVGGGFVQETADRGRNEATAALSWFAKTGNVSHELKLGGAFRRVKYHDFSHYPGPIPGTVVDETGALVDPGGITGQRYNLFAGSYSLIEYDQNSAGTTDEKALFVQDQLKFGERVTLNLGLRFDGSKSTGEKSAEFSDRKLQFGLGDMIAPRVGVVIDVAGNGKSKLSAHWGRFYESIPLDINARSFGNEQFNFYYFYYPSNGSLPNGANQGTLYYAYHLGTGVGVQQGLKAMYSDELVGGFEYEVARNLSIGIKGEYRKLGQVIEDISVDGGSTYFIANVGAEQTFSNNPVTGEALDAPITFPKAVRKYKALEISLNKAFADNWQLTASYVRSKNEGNYGGLFRQDNGQLDPNITSTFDLPSLLKGAFGLLPNDRPNQFKAYGTYRFPFKLTAGFFGEYLSGTPISKLGSHTTYGRRERFIGDRGAFGRTPNIWHFDLHLEYPIKLGASSELRLMADGFNIANQQKASTVDQEWTLQRAQETTNPNECGGTDANCPNANKTFGLATAFQDPRALRFGVKVSW